MMTTKGEILSNLDSLIEEAERLENSFTHPGGMGGEESGIPHHEHRSFATSALAEIERIAGRDSRFYEDAPKPEPEKRLDVLGLGEKSAASSLRGVLSSLRRSVKNDLLRSLESQLRASIHDDLLEQASDLLSQDYYVAAMVLIGGVLENHLQELCENHGLEWQGGGSLSAYNDALKDDLYKQTIWRRIQAVGDDRNNAAHGDAERVDKADVEDHLGFVRRVLSDYPE